MTCTTVARLASKLTSFLASSLTGSLTAVLTCILASSLAGLLTGKLASILTGNLAGGLACRLTNSLALRLARNGAPATSTPPRSIGLQCAIYSNQICNNKIESISLNQFIFSNRWNLRCL